MSEPLVARVTPPGLFSAEIVDGGQPVPLHPEEAALVERAAAKRQRDFALGRACARAALAGLGQSEAVLPIGPQGAPIWPDGISGSITHTDGYAAALVGTHVAGIGLDAERIGGVTEKLFPRLFDESEQGWLNAQPDRAIAATLLFCAKEAAIKAWWRDCPFAFRDIHIEVNGMIFRAAAGKRESAAGLLAIGGGLALASFCAG